MVDHRNEKPLMFALHSLKYIVKIMCLFLHSIPLSRNIRGLRETSYLVMSYYIVMPLPWQLKKKFPLNAFDLSGNR